MPAEGCLNGSRIAKPPLGGGFFVKLPFRKLPKTMKGVLTNEKLKIASFDRKRDNARLRYHTQHD
jgi:hypothetical protein